MTKTISSKVSPSFSSIKNDEISLFVKKLYLFPIVILGLLFSNPAKAQVIADFTATDTAGCAPLVIHFTNTSSGATSYSWNMGNSSTFTATDVSTSYLSAGTYTVTLTARNGALSSTKSMTIRAYGKPSLSFRTSDTSVCPGTPITYINASTANAWGTLNYTWNFGDGSSSHASDPVYSHYLSGRYNIVLFATNSKGCVSALSKPGLINILPPPIPLFNASETYFCKNPAKDTFSNTSTGKAPLSYMWSFGDGSTSSVLKPVHIYTAPGIYTVKLSAKDGNGCNDSTIQTDYVAVSGFKAGFSGPANGCARTPIKFTNTTSTPYTSAKWDFGDGSPVSDSGIHAWAADGTYTVRLVAFNDTCYDTIKHTISITHPTGSFTVNQLCTPASTVTFTASTAPGNTIEWRYGDGNSGTGTTSTYTYHPKKLIDPIYTDSMIITSSLGCSDTVVVIDTIMNLSIDLSSSLPSAGCAPLTTKFGAATQYFYDPKCAGCGERTLPYPYTTTSYLWDFGDGSATSTSPAPSHIYTAVGNYIAKCHIVTSNGCSADATTPMFAGTPPNATFTATTTKQCAGQPITYTVKSTTRGIIENYGWDFGDGTTANVTPKAPGMLPDTVITYRSKEPGVHVIKLTAYNRTCPSITFEVKDTITGTGSIFENTYSCIPANGMIFTKTAIADDDHLWDFGDGTTSTADNPVHNFPALSTYKVTLTTHNVATGCRDTTIKVMEMARLHPNLTPEHTGICRDRIDSFVTIIRATDSTYPVRSAWYFNGGLTNVHFPTPTGEPLTPPNYSDSVTHLMNVRGDNNVTLVITDNHRCLDTVSATVIVAKPIDSFRVTQLTTCRSTPIDFTDVTQDVKGASLVSYSWSFGDGSTTTTTSTIVSHSYTATGTYTVKEIVTDNFGCMDTSKIPTKPVINKPTAIFNSDNPVTCSQSEVNFHNGSTGAISNLWFFGDGNTSSVGQPKHTYTTAGNYDVKLVVTDFAGCTDTLIVKDAVIVHPIPSASFHMDDSFAVCPPMNVNFINTTTDAIVYSWSLGDGNVSGEVYPSNIYLLPGAFDVSLRATNRFGCSDAATGTVRIFGYKGAFSYTPQTLCTSAPVHFSADASHIIKVVWDFGDGITSVPSLQDTISHIYTTPQAYIPKLILTGVSGCFSSSEGADTIKVDSIVAGFTASPDPVCQNSVAVFNDNSASKFSAAENWLWTFGGGATSTLKNPAFSYTVAGSQSVSLQVTDSIGCTSSITKNITVNPVPATITGTPVVCIGQPTTLSDASAGGTWASSSTTIATAGSTGIVTGVRTGTATITYTLPTGCKTTLSATVNPLPAVIAPSPARICATATTTFSDATAGGTWSIDNTAIATMDPSSGLLTGIAAGTATVSYLLPTGCSVTRIITIDTFPTPISGINTVCAGTTIVLSDAINGGTWSSSNSSAATVGAGSGIVSGLAAGSTIITYALAHGCFTTTTVTVNSLPAPIKGPTFNVCEGLEITLTVVNTPGSTWSSSNTAIAIVGSTGVVGGVGAGTATITYTNPSGCIQTAVVTVNSIPTGIFGTPAICEGSNTTLMNITPGGTWSTTSSLINIGSSSGLTTGILAGTATVTYTIGNGCTATTTITVHPLPDAVSGTKDICLDLTTTLSDGATGGTWISADTTVLVNSFSGVITGKYTGTATITYTLPTTCSVTTTVTVHEIPPAITGNTFICPSTTTSLSSASGGSWGSSNTAVATADATGTIRGVAAGTATITYTSDAGCFVLDTVTVYPIIGPILGTKTICKGDTAILRDAIPGGVWSSSSTSIATISTAGIVTGITTGSTTISYSAAKTCDTATAIVTIAPLPNAGVINGNEKICANSSSLLSDSIAGGVWSSSNAGIITADATGKITAGSAGSATISYTYRNSCGSDIATFAMTINPLPAKAHITTHPDTVLCSNTLFQNFGADAPPPAGIHYIWAAVNAVIYATGKDKQYCLASFNMGGTSIIKLSTDQAATDCSSADSIIFHINDNTSPNPSVVYYAPEFVCTDHTADKYQWGYDDINTLDSTLLPGMTNQNYYNIEPQFGDRSYWVLTYHNGCQQKSYYKVPENINTTHRKSNIELLLYPNPADDEINITVKGIGRQEEIFARLIDVNGKSIKSIYLSGGKGSIKLTGCTPGMYMMQFSNNGEQIGSKIFVKQ